MSNLIQLLPDAIANQIAAGEVVQRPASVVKELLENAIDAGASEIKLIVKDAGKTLIQVIDNGCGMNESDARLCFERHATSKIKSADDLFALHTKGFRGEALASIAAIAHTELKTKQANEELGNHLIVEGSTVIKQEPCMCANGSSFSVKNLFYNVPARRQFLKSDSSEMKHIIEEFQRVAIPHADIHFSLIHNNSEVFQLPPGNLKQRIVGVFGKKFENRIVPVTETTDLLKINGFVGKPEFAKKTRGEQYFFVNHRFIKSAYLHHAVNNAFQELIDNKQFPSYFLMLQVDPASIDINIHPTKTEIKFKDERVLYAILKSAVRQSLGKYNIAPSLDFEQESAFNIPLPKANQEISSPEISIDPAYNPFEQEKSNSANTNKNKQATTDNWSKQFNKPDSDGWEDLHQIAAVNIESAQSAQQTSFSPDWSNHTENETGSQRKAFQWQPGYIVTKTKSELVLIDQRRAHIRVLYEEFLHHLEQQNAATQQLLFPETIALNAADFELIKGLQKELIQLGFDIELMTDQGMAVNGVPAASSGQDVTMLLEDLLEQFKNNVGSLHLEKQQQVAYALAQSTAIKHNKLLNYEEMVGLIDQLFACESPFYTCAGKPTIINFTTDEIKNRFK